MRMSLSPLPGRMSDRIDSPGARMLPQRAQAPGRGLPDLVAPEIFVPSPSGGAFDLPAFDDVLWPSS